MNEVTHRLGGVSMAIAFVLSGGGARGDFQLGALRALDARGIVPDIICSTSVGSLNAVMLAQGSAGLDELTRIWLGLRRNDHMWQFEDWWAELRPELRNLIVGAINGEMGAPGTEPWAVHSAMIFGAAAGTIALGPYSLIVGALAGALGGATVAGLQGSLTAEAILDALRIVTSRARSLLNLNPVRAMFDEHFDQGRFDAWAASGKQLRLASVGLQSGALAYVTETGRLIDRNGVELAQGIDIISGAMASSAIATVFPPVPFAGDHWVDGGHRECMPLQQAISMGATEIYVISCSPVDPVSSINRTMDTADELARPVDYGSATMVAIAQRAVLDIHLDEMARDDLYPLLAEAESAGIRVRTIAPTYPTHDIVTIDPELIRVNCDYGYRVASDVLDAAAADARASSDRIALLEGQIGRYRKRTLIANGVPFDARTPAWQAEVTRLKDERAGLSLTIAAPPREDSYPVGSSLMPGDRMLPGQSIMSPNKRFLLIYQRDGNLVLYDTGNGGYAPLWETDTMGAALGCAVMQRDGNLVIYDDALNVVSATGTFGEDARALLLNDGRFVIQQGGRQLFESNAAVAPLPGPGPRPSPVTPPRLLTLTNASPTNARFQLYKTDDTAMAATLPDGDFTLSPGSERAWTFPADIADVKVRINSRYLTTAVGGTTLVHSADDRVRLINRANRIVSVRIFNAADILRVVALSGGEFDLPADGDGYFEMPADIERSVVLVDGRELGVARRGMTLENTVDPYVYVQSDIGAAFQARFYRVDDTWRVATLGGGDVQVPSGQRREFRIPDSLGNVAVVINGVRSIAGPGDTLVVTPAGTRIIPA